MPQGNEPQPELFREFQSPAKRTWWSGRWRWPQRYLIVRLAYEDLILATIGGLMAVVLGFCLGVERGRAVWAATAAATTAPTTAPAEPIAPITRPTPLRPFPARPPVAVTPAVPGQRPGTGNAESPLQPPAKTQLAEGRYVVQLASFLDRQAAEEAKARLLRQEIRATVGEKGRYHVLYAGGFATYAQASEVAGRLRAAYRDCFIRKLTAGSRG